MKVKVVLVCTGKYFGKESVSIIIAVYVKPCTLSSSFGVHESVSISGPVTWTLVKIGGSGQKLLEPSEHGELRI